ncbi:MAG: DUF554 domain-containing protein [Prevotellaceae bacterium]|nr:DUF554 domain-containing protein [Prevotellaceae bacterium]
MIGTITNTCAIVVGSALGRALKRGIRPEWQTVLFDAMGLASIALGANAVCQNMPHSLYPVLFILSLALGGLVGTMLRIDQRLKSLVDRLQSRKTTDTSQRPRLAEGLTTAVLLYCIGTLSILGPINSALLGDETFLLTNATLDFVSSIIFAATYGFGIALAAPVLFCWQGGIWLVARLSGSIIPPALLTEMGIVGGILIISSGLGILHIKDLRTLNLLPALFIPPLFFLLKSLLC